MEGPVSSIEALFERVEAYGRVTLELTRLKALQAATKALAGLGTRLAICFFLLLFVLVTSLGVALWLGDEMGKLYYGFFVVGGFYLLVGLVIRVMLFKWVKRLLTKTIIRQIFQD